MAVNPNQLKSRKSLDQIASGVSGVELDDLLQSIDKELKPPFAMRKQASHVVSIDSHESSNPIVDNDGDPAASGAGNDTKRVAAPIADGIPFSFTGGTVTIPTANNANITHSTSGTTSLLNIGTDLFYVRVGISINNLGVFTLTQGTEAATIAAAGTPAVTPNELPIGHFIVQRDDSGGGGNEIKEIETTNIYQYVGASAIPTAGLGNETTDQLSADESVIAGNTKIHPFLDIPVGRTYTVNGRLIVAGTMIVAGTLIDNGEVINYTIT